MSAPHANPDGPTFEQLLGEAGWVRRLVARLLADADATGCASG